MSKAAGTGETMSRPKRSDDAGAKKSLPATFSMADLEGATGFTARTIRYYVTEGIVPPPRGRGPAATYGQDQYWRLRMIAELKTKENLSLEKIGERLKRLGTADIEAHFSIGARPVDGRWRRVIVHPDLEINVRELAEPNYRFEQAVDKMLKYARFIIDDLETD